MRATSAGDHGSVWRRMLSICTVVWLGTACGGGGGSGGPPPPTPPPTPTADTVAIHLYCYDCTDGEVDDVGTMGDRAIPQLEAALRGPDAAALTNARLKFALMWQRAAEYQFRRGGAPSMTEADFVAAGMPNFTAGVQGRAVWGLAAVGTPDAQTVLLEALADFQAGRLSYRADVVLAIQAALATF